MATVAGLVIAAAEIGLRVVTLLEIRQAAIEARAMLRTLPARINAWPLRRRAWLAWRVLRGRMPGLEAMK